MLWDTLVLSGLAFAEEAPEAEGLATNRSLLIVIDGAKALRKAVVDVFGAHALIQRCREHKKRKVTDALPERLRGVVRGDESGLRDARP